MTACPHSTLDRSDGHRVHDCTLTAGHLEPHSSGWMEWTDANHFGGSERTCPDCDAALAETDANRTDRIADALERIAAALERAYPLDLRDSGLTRAWDDAEIDRNARADAEDMAGSNGDDDHRIGATLPDPNRCEPGCIRPSLHGGDCDVRVVADPLDESDHRVRHDRYDQHWERAGKQWVASRGHSDGSWVLDELDRFRGPLTFCDCPDPVTEAENRAGD